MERFRIANSEVSNQEQSKLEQSQKRTAAAVEYGATLTEEQILSGDYDESKLNRIADDFYLNESDYQILPRQAVWTGRNYQNGQPIKRVPNIDETACLMVGRTQNLIYSIDSTDKEKEPLPDEIIYLDKSGRPVSWLVNTFWDDFAQRDSNGNVTKRPPHSYVNIDRGAILERFFDMTILVGDAVKSKDGTYYEHFSDAWEEKKKELKPEHFAMLRALYLDEGITSVDEATPEKIMKMPSRLDGKNIMIIDEVSSAQSTTLTIAKTLFEGAFPRCKVRTKAFWHELADKSVPVWYDRDNVEGRGIGDINPRFFEERLENYSDSEYLKTQLNIPEEKIPEFQPKLISRARAQHYGRLLLSMPVNLEIEHGQLTRKLTDDIRQLHKDYEAHRILPYGGALPFDDRYDIEIVRQGVSDKNYSAIRDELFSRQ